MTKIEKFTKRPTCNKRLSGNLKAAPQVIVNWKPCDSSPAVFSVKFMELRPRMCRWPTGDPQHLETFSFCGSACPSKASYCKTHNAIAHPSSRTGTSRPKDFHMGRWVA
jgi:hypothetical protein